MGRPLDGLAGAYEPDVVEDLAHRLVALAARPYADRRPGPQATRPASGCSSRTGSSTPACSGYAAYADRFAGDLRGVAEHVPYLGELGVTYLHLMPLLQPRPGPNDGGYAVADYRTVRPGPRHDRRPARAGDACCGRHGISLCLDLVLNHVAREHAWAEAARAGDPTYRRFFHIHPDRAVPDAYERTLPEVFPDFAPGSFTWDDDVDGWVWTTFNSWQWDLDWSNPDVVCAYADIILFLANLGVEVLRLDAIAFIWKRLGTTCQNQPEVHAITQALRAVTRMAAPAVVFKAEAIVAPADVVHYLGRGRHHGKVSDLAYHNSLMVQIWSMLASRDVRLSVHVLRAISEIPATTAWITYVRCHDDIGWAIDDADAAAVGLSGPAHRAVPVRLLLGRVLAVTGARHRVPAQRGDRRPAHQRDAGQPGRARRRHRVRRRPRPWRSAIDRILLTQTIAIGWGGVPVLWMGDELALRNDAAWADDPAPRRRQPLGAPAARCRGTGPSRRHRAGTVEQRVFDGLVHRVGVRAGLEHFDASVRVRAAGPDRPRRAGRACAATRSGRCSASTT